MLKSPSCLSALSLVLAALLPLGCGSADDTSAPTSSSSSSGVGGGAGGGGGGQGGAGQGGGGKGGAYATCAPAAAGWTPGTKAFREATAGWGLDALGVEATRFNAVDFDNDGWTDLIARRGDNGPDDFAPGGVRRTWLLRNTGHGTFEDVTEASLIVKNRTEVDATKGRTAVVFAFADVDNDGDLDAFTGMAHGDVSTETSEVMLNNGDGTFSLGPEANQLRRKPPKSDGPAGASFVDFNRDGFVDLWITQVGEGLSPQQDRLYRGDGTGMFVEETSERGLTTKSWSIPDNINNGLSHTVSWSATACDLNGDGNPELLSASYGRAPNHLWQSLGAEGEYRYANRSVVSGYAFDDNQDWSDNQSARCWCKLHPTDVGCAGVPAPAYSCTTDDDAFRWNNPTDRELYRLGGNSGTTLCADMNNDGFMDLVTTEIVHGDVGGSSDSSELLLNKGTADVAFERPGNANTGLARQHSGFNWNEGIMTASAFDFDNDGWLDLYWGDSDYPGTYGRLYRQVSPGKFEAVALADGIDHHRSHGSAVADFDRDGDLDIVVGHSSMRCEADCYPEKNARFFENVAGPGGHFIQLALVGAAGTNRSAIGARVTLEANGVKQTKEVGGGYGQYGAQDDLTLHFGIADACGAEVTIRWPDASLTTQKLHVDMDHRYRIVQGEEPKLADAN